MSSMSELERGYRRLVAFYPRSFRRENGEEIIAVLLATAADGQRRPGPAESADLLKGAFRMRVGLSRAPYTVVTAVRLMVLGAVAELATLVTALATWGAIQSATLHHYPQYAALATHAVNDNLVADMVVLPIATLAWLVVAWGVGKGSQWARLAAIILAMLSTMSLILKLTQDSVALAPAAMIVGGVAWALSIVAVAFLLHPRSWPYYPEPDSAPRQEVRL
jgi:hypothetical protein